MADYNNKVELADYRGIRSRRGSIDMPLLLLVLLLLGIGLIMLLSASYARSFYSEENPMGIFIKQLIFAGLGIVAMYFTSVLPISFYKKYAMWVLYAAIVLLILVLAIGTTANGAKRWINFGIFTLQPSEIAKLGVILSFSALICKYKSAMKSFKYGVLPFIFILGSLVVLLVFEPHLSAIIIIILLGAVLMFLGGVKFRWFIILGAIMFALFMVYISVFGYANDRITTWLDPEKSTSQTGYQINQSLYAIGSGGLSGLGFGNSRQKFMYLPEEHNDFIFSIVCEELGYIGAITILILFALLIVRGFWLAIHCTDRFSFLVCAGISTLFALQVVLNIAVVTNLIPCTGVSLPFFSSGGSALLLQLAEVGIILSISRDIPEKRVRRSSGTKMSRADATA